ncbi:hypothetical protein FRC06_000499 [Ceratobasidium sp. 370]|nr:hypothetical protein FRC06_000499 [Ceratobasidium sp. 370]
MAGRGDSEYVLAMHDFEPVNGNSTCLSFRAGQVIHVLNKDSTGWWDGELEGRRGWFPSNYVKAGKKARRKGSPSSESGSEAESCPRVMVSLYHALLVLNTSVHAARVSHYQPSTACVISSVRTVLTATDCLHKTAPALARFPHLARARSDVLQELGRLVTISKKASAPDVADDERAWLAENMLRYGDAVFASCKRYVEVAVSCGIHVTERRPQLQLSTTTNNLPPPRLTSASASSLSSISSSTSPPSPAPQFPTGPVSSSQLLSALRTTHDHLLSIIAAFIGHVHSHSRASHASSKGHLIEMTRETVDKVRQVLTIVGAVCDHPAVVGPEQVALAAAKDALYGATSVLVEAVKRMLAPTSAVGGVGREEEEKAVAVQAATGTLRAGGDCVTAVRSYLTRHAGAGYGTGGVPLGDAMYPLVFEVPAAPPSVSDHTRSMSSASASGSEVSASAYAHMYGRAGGYVGGTVRASRASMAARQRASVASRWPRRPSVGVESMRGASEEDWRRRGEDSSEDEPRRSGEPRRSRESPLGQGRSGSGDSAGRTRRPSPSSERGYIQAKHQEEAAKPWNGAQGLDRSGLQHEPEHTPFSEPQPSHDEPYSYSQPPDQSTPQPTQIRPYLAPEDEIEVGDASLTVRPGAGERDPTATEVPPPKVEQEPRASSQHGPRAPAEQAQAQEETDGQAPMPVVISSASSVATTSRGASFDAPSSFGRSSGAPSASFDRVRTSVETGLTSIEESAGHAVFRAREGGAQAAGLVGQDRPMDDQYDPEDGESLMVEPAVMLIRTSHEREEEDDDAVLVDPQRTPVPPQVFHASDSAIDLENSTPSGNQRSLPGVPEPIAISPGVDWLAAQTIDPRDVAHNNDGNLIGATLDVLVEKMTPPDHSPEPQLSAIFYLTFRLFTTPLELVQVLHRRWDLQPPLGSSFTPDEYRAWSVKKLEPVRLRVYNFIKTWLDLHWQPNTDLTALGPLKEFVSVTATEMPPHAVQRVVDLLTQRDVSPDTQDNAALLAASTRPAMMDRVRSTDRARAKPNSAPTPVLSRSLFASLKAGAFGGVNIMDFDALELARQFTIMESKLFCKILPEEILDVGLPSSAGERGNSIRAMSTLSTAITGWVTEMILDEQDTKKRTGFLKFFIKISDQCHDLNNFSTLRSILAALDSSTISRLNKTWAGLSAKSKVKLENLRKLTDHTRNHHEYRTRLRSVHGNAVPFLGLYLTDVTFCREGNPDKRISPYDNSRTLLNFDKYRRLAAIADDVKRFQVPYNLIEIPEVQKYLEFSFEKAKKNGNDLHDLYRRSLLVEPRQPADNIESKTGTLKSSELFGWASRDKS